MGISVGSSGVGEVWPVRSVDSLNHLQCDHDHHSVGPPAFLRGDQKSTHELKEPEEVERNGGARL